jgi:hypothetical protein
VLYLLNESIEGTKVLIGLLHSKSTPASAATIPNWLELFLLVQVPVDPLDANAAEATSHP